MCFSKYFSKMYFNIVVFPARVEAIKQNEAPPVFCGGSSTLIGRSSIFIVLSADYFTQEETKMDLLKQMMANREAKGMGNGLVVPPPPSKTGRRKPTKEQKSEGQEPGSKSMRIFIIEEKPSKKVVRKHFLALVEKECASESESD